MDSLAKGWIVSVKGERCRVLGRVDAHRWRLERTDTKTRQTFTYPIGAVEMARVEASLRGRGLLPEVLTLFEQGGR